MWITYVNTYAIIIQHTYVHTYMGWIECAHCCSSWTLGKASLSVSTVVLARMLHHLCFCSEIQSGPCSVGTPPLLPANLPCGWEDVHWEGGNPCRYRHGWAGSLHKHLAQSPHSKMDPSGWRSSPWLFWIHGQRLHPHISVHQECWWGGGGLLCTK